MKPLLKIIGFVFLLLLAALCYWIYDNIQFVERKIETTFQGAAAKNPLLAAGRLVERYGAAARYVPAYRNVPPPGAILVFTSLRFGLSEEKNDALLHWVKEQGGHLIIMSEHGISSKDGESIVEEGYDPLLDDFGIYTTPAENVKENKADRNKAKTETQKLLDRLESITRNDEPDYPEVTLPDSTRLKVKLNPDFQLFMDDDEQFDFAPEYISGPSGNVGLKFALGKGQITVLNSFDFIYNHHINRADNAAFFVYLVSPKKDQTIWFVYGYDVPALWRWLVNNAWTVLIAAAFLLAVWLWMISRRFGPLLPICPSTRRSIVEHISASARYLWQHDRQQTLYRMLCDDFRKHVYLRHPHWSQLSPQELSPQIVHFLREANAAQTPQTQQLSALTEHAIEHLLDADRPRDAKQFTANSQLLETLRTSL